MRRAIRVLGIGVGLLAAALSALALRASAHAPYQHAQRYEDVYYLPPPDALRVMSLGWDEALADLIWLRALIYFGEELEHGGDVEHVYAYAEAMVELDPDFAAAYRWVGTAALYRPVAITAADVERAVAFMQRGARRFPMNGELAYDIGGALAYELTPLLDGDEAKARARARAVPYLLTAARLGAGPEWLVLSNATTLTRLGQTEQAARHLEDMYASTEDPAIRAQIGERIRSLREQADAEAFLVAMEELEQNRQRDFPYAPAGLFLLLGPRPPVELAAPLREGLPRALTAPPRAPVPEPSPDRE